ncbi:hypothetical protein [Thermus sp.]|nr:hypothetical protein [Thermus sp.]
MGLFWGGVLGLEGLLALGGLFLSLLGREVFLRCPRKPPGGP